MQHPITADARRASLSILLKRKPCLRILETHSPLSALLAEQARVDIGDGACLEFDGFWSSSLTDSTLLGKPDIEVLDIPSRLSNINDIFEVTTKPLIMDGDTGGKPEHFVFHVRSMERLGVSAVIIEDKTGLKKNSLLGNEVEQHQESIPEFSGKISLGKAAQATGDFMIIARIESLILDAGLEDALLRASAYVDAGADGVMIHSRKKQAAEVVEFARRFRAKYPSVPLVCVPTSYSSAHFEELEAAGFNIVIYANHLLRASYLAMQTVAHDILRFGRTAEVEERCLSINEILELIPGTK
jgi:phosphoenolpyruvate phosphomutase